MPLLSVPSTRQSLPTALARALGTLRAWGRPTPTPHEYWGNSNTSVGWWKAL